MAGVGAPDALEPVLQDEIAALAMRQFQEAAAARGREGGAAALEVRGPPPLTEERRAGGGAGAGGAAGGGSAASTSRPAEVLTTAELAERMAREAEEMDKDLRGPMAPAEYRRRQAMGIRPEVACVGERLAERYPHLLLQPPTAGQQHPRKPAEDLDALAQASVSSGVVARGLPSQMPAVATAEGGGCLTKTIEHYTFVDSEDSATLGVHFDKHLWDGAAGCIAESQVLVDVRATSLDVRLRSVPVGPHTEALADWRLSLSPLFSRVEPLLATHRVRNGKLTVRLAKARAGAWKRAVK